MLAVSSNFTAAEKADANQVAAKIYLVLGNYASSSAYGASASASSSDGSGDYPAAGAIDGDRTEINVGPASGADNDVGQSSWRSATAPSVTPQTLTINFGKSRTINRIKLYHLSSHGLKSYKLESSPDNITYTLIDKTTDQSGGIATTNQLDTIDFSDTTCQYVKLTISDTVVGADKANVVEIECYRKVDITNRIVSAKINRSRDYKLQNPIAASFMIECDNSDRFFSFSHTPTSAEVTSGFVNSELAPNIGVIMQYGFAYGGNTPELATVFNGFVDRLSIDPASRKATIEGRDLMKPLINQITSSKLKSSADIKTCLQYALNLANISNFEMSLDTTSLNVDYFFINNQSLLTVIRDLVQASADAAFYFDESGIATFKYYVNSTPQSHTDTSEADFEAGTVLTNIDTVSTPSQISRKWFLIDDFADGNFNLNPVWTNRAGAQTHTDATEADFEAGTVLTNVDTTSVPNQIGKKWFIVDNFSDSDLTNNPAWNIDTGSWSVVSNAAHVVTPGKIGQNIGGIVVQPRVTDGLMRTSGVKTTGTFRCRIQVTNGAGTGTARFFFMHNGFVFSSPLNTSTFSHGIYANGYFVEVTAGNFVRIGKTDASGSITYLGNANTTLTNSGVTYEIRLTRDASGNMNVYVNNTLQPLAACTDTSIVSSQYIGFVASDGSSGGVTWATYDFSNVFYSPALDGLLSVSSSQTVFESQVIDQSINVVTEGLFQATYVVPSGSSLSFFTAVSSDNVSYDAYVAVTPGGLIQSATKRYIKWKAVFTTPNDNNVNNNFDTPTIQSVSISYTLVGWQVVSQQLKFAPGTSSVIQAIDTALIPVIGTWRAKFKMTVGSASGEKARMYILTTGYDQTNTTYLSGYYAELDQAAGKVRIGKISASAARTTLVEASQTLTSATTYSIRLTRTSTGLMTLYVNEVSACSVTDTAFSATTTFAFEVDPNSDQNGSTIIDDVYYSPQVDGSGAISTAQAVFESQVIDMTASFNALGIFQFSDSVPTGCALAFYTATSTDGVTFDAYVAANLNTVIASAAKRYLKWKAIFTCPIDDGNHNANFNTPFISDVTVNWFVGSGTNKFPTSVSYTFRFDTSLLAISQEYADNLGGDSAILNDVLVQAKPLYLSGADTDTQWQGTTQTPPVAVSAGAPIAVSAAQVLTYAPIISGGMDTSHMSGASPSAAAITAPAGTTWKFTTIHPTRPVLQITIGGTPGNITDLRLVGKSFSNSNTVAIQNSKDSASIRLYGDRQLSISNQYITNPTLASTVASKLVANYKNPTSYIPGATVRPTFSAQINDRVTVVDDNTDLNGDYVIAGIQHEITAALTSAVAQTDLLLLKVS